MADTTDTTAQDANVTPAVDIDPLQDPLALSAVLSHCGNAAVATIPSDMAAISSQKDLNAKPNRDGEPPHFEYAEHRYLGDLLELSEHNDNHNPKGVESDKSAKYNPFTLPNGLSLTYGEINGLAGDFFGSNKPICKGEPDTEKLARFQEAYNLLATSSEGRAAAEQLKKTLQIEVDAVNDAIQGIGGKTVEEVYAMLDQDFTLDKITISLLKPGVTYLELAQKNLDHFGHGARTAYNVGHGWALQVASSGKKDDLLRAYTINAFADHFLEDSFSAGHLRVPREAMIDNKFSNLCAKFMHDEDNKFGVHVETIGHDKSWRTYGDKKLFNTDDEPNKAQLYLALTHSVGEVYDAYHNKTAKTDPNTFDVWKFAGTEQSANSRTENFAPLFRIIDNAPHYRKVLSSPGGGPPPKTFEDSDYDRVVSNAWYMSLIPASVKVPVSWAILAYQLAPTGFIKDEVKAYLRSKVPKAAWWILGLGD